MEKKELEEEKNHTRVFALLSVCYFCRLDTREHQEGVHIFPTCKEGLFVIAHRECYVSVMDDEIRRQQFDIKVLKLIKSESSTSSQGERSESQSPETPSS